jgi:hypothetical protein
MNEYKTKLLNKYLNNEYLNDFEEKKFNEYLDKTNVFTYCTTIVKQTIKFLYDESSKEKPVMEIQY